MVSERVCGRDLRWVLCFWRRELRRGVRSVIVGREFELLGRKKVRVSELGGAGTRDRVFGRSTVVHIS